MTPLSSLSPTPLPPGTGDLRARGAAREAEAPRSFSRALGTARGESAKRSDEAAAGDEKSAPSLPRKTAEPPSDDTRPAGDAGATRAAAPEPTPTEAAAASRSLVTLAGDAPGAAAAADPTAAAEDRGDRSVAALSDLGPPGADGRPAPAGAPGRHAAHTTNDTVAAARMGTGAASASASASASATATPPATVTAAADDIAAASGATATRSEAEPRATAGPRSEPGGFVGSLATALHPAAPPIAAGAPTAPSPPPAAEAALAQPPGSAGFAPELAARLSTFVREGIEQARLHLNPAEMGPVEVRIALDGSAARVLMAAEQAPTRQWLEQALPTLAAGLREAGLTLAGGGVFERAPDGHGGQDGRSGQDAPRTPAGGLPGSADGAAETTSRALGLPRRRGVVDLVA